MTSGAITEAGMAFGSVSGNKPNNASKQQGTNDSFAKTMQGISGGQNNQNQQSTMQISEHSKNHKTPDKQDTVKQPGTDKTEQKVKEQTSTENKDAVENKNQEKASSVKDTTEQSEVNNQVEDVEELDADVEEAVMDAVNDMIQNVADELDVSEEDVKAAMETLGLQMIDILNPEQLNQIVAEISGADMMTLVTDENLYSDLQNLTGDLQDTLQSLSEELGMTEEDLQGLLDKVKETFTESGISTTETKLATLEKITVQEEIPVLMQENTGEVHFQKNMPEQPKGEEPVQQPTNELQENNEKVMPSEAHASSEEEHTEEHMPQEHAENNITNFQNKLEDTVAMEETVKDPLYQTPDTESILKQLSDYMKTKFSENMTEMEMQLHPASLGTVNLQIASKAGAITAQFSVQNEEVKQAMESQIVQLKENLEQQGVKIEAVEVTVASHSFERNSGEQNQEQNAAYEEERNKIKPIRRRILNLNDYTDLGEISEVEDDAARIAMEMMAGNGNTLDMLA